MLTLINENDEPKEGEVTIREKSAASYKPRSDVTAMTHNGTWSADEVGRIKRNSPSHPAQHYIALKPSLLK